jgi:predicted patatin/cPLA2 family phospholipase
LKEKLSKQLLNKHDSYIEALQEALTEWNNTQTEEGKRDYMLAIGEIGNEIYKQNKILDIAHMKCID